MRHHEKDRAFYLSLGSDLDLGSTSYSAFRFAFSKHSGIAHKVLVPSAHFPVLANW